MEDGSLTSFAEFASHILRTILLVALLTGGILGVLLLLPPGEGFPSILIVIVGFVYFSARWHAHWAPTAKKVSGA